MFQNRAKQTSDQLPTAFRTLEWAPPPELEGATPRDISYPRSAELIPHIVLAACIVSAFFFALIFLDDWLGLRSPFLEEPLGIPSWLISFVIGAQLTIGFVIFWAFHQGFKRKLRAYRRGIPKAAYVLKARRSRSNNGSEPNTIVHLLYDMHGETYRLKATTIYGVAPGEAVSILVLPEDPRIAVMYPDTELEVLG